MQKIYFKLLLGLSLLISLQVQANPKVLKGKLIGSNGHPVSGAKLELISDPTTYAITNGEGEYSINVLAGDTVLVTTSDLFSKQVVLSENQTITLAKESSPLNMGFGLVKNNSHSTVAASTVFAQDLEKSSAHVNASNALFGELLGLNVLERSGVNDSKRAKLDLRGMGSPLVLVDGFERDINDINVEEIESITLLKDAASLAIYGFRGSNGVLNITTKRGKYNTVEIDFSYDHSFNFAQETVPMVDAYTYALGLNEALANDGLSPRYNEYQLEAFKSGSQPLVYPNVDWMSESLGNLAHSNSYNFQVRGGGEKIRYFSSIGYDTDNGLIGVDAPESSIPNQFKYSNLNVRSNLDIALSKSTLLKINLLGKLKENSSPKIGVTNLMNTVYNTPAAAFPVKTENGEWGSSTTWTKNPVADLMNAGFYKYHNRVLWTDIALEQNLDAITKGLKARVNLAYDSDAVIYEKKTKDYRTETITPQFDESGNPLEVEYNQVGENDGSYSFSSWLSTQWHKTTVQGIVDYERSVGLSNVKVGYITQLSSIVGKGVQKTYKRLNNSLYFSYDYDDRYMLDASLTMAASNVLDPNDKWGYFPALSAAWVISKEKSMQQSSVVDYLKLRASWGIMGSDHMGFDYWKQDYKSGGSVRFGNFVSVPTMQMGTLAVNNLTYAKTRTINIGVEGTLFKNLDFMVELYHNNVSDILTNISDVNSSVLGVDPGYANNGEVSYKGVEIGFGYHQRKGDFKYEINGQFAFNRSKIINMNERFWKNDFNKATGHAVGQIFGYEAIGFFKDQADIESSPVQTFGQVQPGDVKYKDQDGNKIIDQYDRVAIGNSYNMPELYFSLGLNLEYRNVGMKMMFQGVGNYSTILSTGSIYRPLVGNKNISQHYYDNRWTPENQNALYPRLTTEVNDNNRQNSTIWLQDRSYLKLRCAEMYYNLPKSLTQKVKLSNTKIFVRGYNLLSLDHLKIGDPEATGISYPLYRTVNVGVKASF